MASLSLLSPRRFLQGAYLAGMAAVVIGAAGCQSFAPKDMSKLTSNSNDKRVVKLAKADPFPSPADVGLEQAPEATK